MLGYELKLFRCNALMINGSFLYATLGSIPGNLGFTVSENESGADAPRPLKKSPFPFSTDSPHPFPSLTIYWNKAINGRKFLL